ncbi:MAG: RNase adapter RapZ [Magnetococcales bacterium]|nr:RNase adapter RapZ [Magnetococcales bacterium]
MNPEKQISHLVILTGCSGAGISSSLKHLQDMGFSWMDNPPPEGILSLIEHSRAAPDTAKRWAIGLHWHEGYDIASLKSILETLSHKTRRMELVFLEAKPEVLVSRYRETRRRHPMAENRTVSEAVLKEINGLQPLRAMANTILDTSKTTLPEHKERLQRLFETKTSANLIIVLRSFGFKYGINTDADMVLDARFLPNPYYLPELRDLTGLEAPVQAFLAQDGDVQSFLDRLVELFAYLLPRYEMEKKHYFTIDIGCTGGHHRSVFLVRQLSQRLDSMGYQVLVRHRELER